jgi:ParB family transcriptional regulator, chromosome partitioning protein
MSDSERRRGLGRGLAALMGEAMVEVPPARAPGLPGQPGQASQPVLMVPVELLRPGRFQPRQHFDAEQIESLAQSLKEKGILQPILVRRHPEGREHFYEIVAGERRWRAAQLAQLHEVPIILRDLADREALEIAIVENVQRTNLSPLEEAAGYERLLLEFDHTQEDLAQVVGKSRSHVANTLRLLKLPASVKAMLADGRLTAGHGRALLQARDPRALAERVVRQELNVRQTERLAAGEANAAKQPPPVRRAAADAGDANLRALERELQASLGLKVSLSAKGEAGTLAIHYRTLDQLDTVLAKLRR